MFRAELATVAQLTCAVWLLLSSSLTAFCGRHPCSITPCHAERLQSATAEYDYGGFSPAIFPYDGSARNFPLYDGVVIHTTDECADQPTSTYALFAVFAKFLAAESAATETFYRTMSQANYDTLAATGKVPATSETFISPSPEYAQQYNGVTVQFNVQAGTQNALMGMGVRNSAAGFAGTAYEGLPMVQSGWGSSSAFFKMEGTVWLTLDWGEARR
jgi:hypothetical protein